MNLKKIIGIRNERELPWDYDYISKNGSKTWNAYLMSSSVVSGQVVYRLLSSPRYNNREIQAPRQLGCAIKFGAGNKNSGYVATRKNSSNRNLSLDELQCNMNY